MPEYGLIITLTIVVIVPALRIAAFFFVKFAMKIIIVTEIFPRRRPLKGIFTALRIPPRNPSENAHRAVRFFIEVFELLPELLVWFTA